MSASGVRCEGNFSRVGPKDAGDQRQRPKSGGGLRACG